MPEWSGKTRGGIAGYKSFVFIIRYLGISSAYFILRFVVLYFLLFAPEAVRYSFIYLHKRQGFSLLKSYRYIGKMFYKLGQVLIDKIALLSGMAGNFSFDYEGEEHLYKMSDTSGGILIGLHAGSWEIAGHFLSKLNTRIHIVVYANEHQHIQQFLSGIYTGGDINFIVIRDDYSHLFEISKALSNKEIVALHGDRFRPGSKTVSKDFFKETARFPYGPFLLPVKYDVPVSFVATMKVTSSHYHFYATEPLKFDAIHTLDERDEAVNRILDKYIKFLEKVLKKYPDQWFNFYDFWEDHTYSQDETPAE